MKVAPQRRCAVFSATLFAVAAASLWLLPCAAGYARGFESRDPKYPVEPTFADVKYGPAARNVLDFWQAKSPRPAPLVVYIHGGGFGIGDKNTLPAQLLTEALAAGVNVAAINYRFVNGKDVMLPDPMFDSARAVQFLRSQASQWNIDPRKVACCGGSAGAGISLWIGFHDDLADPRSEDPVLRQSSRIQVVGTWDGQCTYDPLKIKELIGGQAWRHAYVITAFGLRTFEDALRPTPEQQKRYEESAPITYLTKDDPSVYMIYTERDKPLPPDAPGGWGIHHPKFGKFLGSEMDKLGIESVYLNTEEDRSVDPLREMLRYFQEKFAAVK